MSAPPPVPAGRAGGKRRRRGGRREAPMVPDVEFSSYYGRPVVKPPPWDEKIAAYLFFGGVAGGSAVLAAGAQLTGRPVLRRNSRLAALTATGLGAVALIADLGRPERFVNMLRIVKPTSPMNLGSWLLSAFGAGAGVAAAAEVDRLSGGRLPLGRLRPVLHATAPAAGLEAALLAPPLAVYTAVLLGDTAVPTWNDAHRDLPFVFAGSASLAAGGLAMITTPIGEAAPARRFALLGVVADLVATRVMEQRMDPVTVEPLHQGRPGRQLRWAQRLVLAGGVGTALGGRYRPVAALSGLALLAGSALTRLGIFEAGIASAKDPRYTVEPQKRRLAARRAAGVVDDGITTVG
ncbi:NrfD/PsrC family molybdoenzyme membrane anchor subunit [Mycolicibacillus trivialis]|uniref:Nitrite reductase n=1 Tax=Mycolicibacillus trivialis TaxID=1798 RepID=A0A1X2EJC3_9MYCO|nr:NrfD/PsrC family molybdoenzyme membrane anchor subunit [Mycolicibacillus trivialis]ORX03639.1 nitrite reductase [Mycolicibacillus trivialis]